MLLTIVLGIASSVLTDAVRALDKRLVGTALQGQGAFLLAFGCAFVAAGAKVLLVDQIPELQFALKAAWTYCLAIFALSQAWFHLVAKVFDLRISQD